MLWQPFGAAIGRQCQSTQALFEDPVAAAALPPPPPPAPEAERQACAESTIDWRTGCPSGSVAFYNSIPMPSNVLCSSRVCGQAVSDWEICCSHGGQPQPPPVEPEPEPELAAGNVGCVDLGVANFDSVPEWLALTVMFCAIQGTGEL